MGGTRADSSHERPRSRSHFARSGLRLGQSWLRNPFSRRALSHESSAIRWNHVRLPQSATADDCARSRSSSGAVARPTDTWRCHAMSMSSCWLPTRKHGSTTGTFAANTDRFMCGRDASDEGAEEDSPAAGIRPYTRRKARGSMCDRGVSPGARHDVLPQSESSPAATAISRRAEGGKTRHYTRARRAHNIVAKDAAASLLATRRSLE